jgi:flagellar basal-body rod protein FlgC
MFSNFDISASGLTAQRLRMDLIAENIANAKSTRTESGEPYRRKLPVFQAKGNSSDFTYILRSMFNNKKEDKGVQVAKIVDDMSPFKIIFNPSHPDANEDGYVKMPNVDVLTEMVDMIDASRAYEANVTVLNISKNMAMKALEIGRG